MITTRNTFKKKVGSRIKTDQYSENKVICYDFETTGLNPYRDQIIEIGAVDNLDTKFSEFCKCDRQLSTKVVEITGITDSILESNGKDCKTAIIEFLNYINIYSDICENVFMIAHNNDGFDELFLRFHLQKFSTPAKKLELPDNLIFIDSMRMAQLILPHMNYFSQVTLSKYYNIHNPSAHRAISDAETLQKLFNVLYTIFYQTYKTKDLKYIKYKIQNPYN